MPAEVLEYVKTDEVQAGVGNVLNTSKDFLRAINAKTIELKAAAEKSRDSQTIRLVDKIAEGLQSRVGEVCREGKWGDLQDLSKEIGKFEHTVRKARREVGKENRRNKARGISNGIN